MNKNEKQICFAKNVKPKTVYYMTYDFWPHGGEPVVLKKKVPAKSVWKGARGFALVMSGVEINEEFVISPDAWLFAEKP